MENLIIEKTQQSPEVMLQNDGNFLIKGISIMNYAPQFYEPLFTWLRQFKHKKPKEVKVVLEIYYMNTSSTAIMVGLLKTINSFKEHGTALNITWCYEEDDEDILDMGADIQLTTKSDFEFLLIR